MLGANSAANPASTMRISVTRLRTRLKSSHASGFWSLVQKPEKTGRKALPSAPPATS